MRSTGPVPARCPDPAGLRHAERRTVQRLRCGDLEIEVRGRAVTVADRRVVLGPNALSLFKVLAASPTVVSRTELLRCLPEHAEDHALEVAMSRLRWASMLRVSSRPWSNAAIV